MNDERGLEDETRCRSPSRKMFSAKYRLDFHRKQGIKVAEFTGIRQFRG